MTTQIQNILNENKLQFDFVGTNNNNQIIIELPKSTNKLVVARLLKSLELEFIITSFGFEIKETVFYAEESNYYFEDDSNEDDFDYSNF